MSVNLIHKQMLNEIGDQHDKSDGGFVYDITRSIALVVDKQSVKSNDTVDKLDVNNLIGDELKRFVYQRAGVEWKAPTFATTEVVFNGAPNTIIEVDSLVAADEVFYQLITPVLIDDLGRGIGTVRCQLNGPIGNVPMGAINSMPVTLSGITRVENPNAVRNGYVGESDEVLRQRYYDKLRRPGKAGNIYHYEEWAKSVVGVGKVDVIPLWDGPLTVKVIVVDSNNEIPSNELLSEVLEYIESERPFGATVTVVAPSSVLINISADITVAEGLNVEDVRELLESKVELYLKSLVFNAYYVSRAQIGRIILETPGIEDYINLTINGGTSNIDIPEANIPVLGTVTLL